MERYRFPFVSFRFEPNRGATENCKAEAAGNRATIRPEKQSISKGTASFEA